MGSEREAGFMKNLKDRIDEMINQLYKPGIDFLMSPLSPIETILKTALTSHTTPQCKIRSTIEGFYSWYQLKKVSFCLTTDEISIKIPSEFYLEISESLIEYANLVFNNAIEIEFYRNLIFQKWIPYTTQDFPYLIMDVNDRVKSLISEVNDLVDKTLKRFICKGLLENADEIFGDEELNEAKTILKSLARSYSLSRNKDVYGIMFVIEYYDRIRDDDNPEFIKAATLRLGENCVKYFKQNNIRILKVKDFITNPKPYSHYSSFQFVSIGLNTPLELQFKSLSMHKQNEDPDSPASHKRYKNRPFNNYLNEIVDQIYGTIPLAPKEPSEKDIFLFEFKREEILNARMGITEGIPLFGVSRIHQAPNGEIPNSLSELQCFEKMELLEELYSKYN